MKPDIAIRVRFKTTKEGGRKTPIQGDIYSCPMFVDGEGFECRLLLAGEQISLGESYNFDVKFMNRDLVLPKLHKRKKISLWEGKIIADGEVLHIYP